VQPTLVQQPFHRQGWMYEDAAVVLLFSLVASGQIKLHRIDGWRTIAAVLNQRTGVSDAELQGLAVKRKPPGRRT
jgi:hypothetical protein